MSGRKVNFNDAIAAVRAEIAARPQRVARKQPERKFVVQAVEYLNRVLPHGSFVTVIPAGHKDQRRNIGYRVGTPDILCIVPRAPHAGSLTFFFEAKAKGKTVTDAQIDAHGALNTAGVDVGIIRTLADVDWYLTGWAVKIRGRIAA